MPSGKTQLIRGRVEITVGALTALSAILGTLKIDGSQQQGVRMKKLKACIEWFGKTNAEGPLEVGVCMGLTAAEVAVCINGDPQHYKDPDQSESTNRKVFPVWMIPSRGTNLGGTGAQDSLPQRFFDLRIPSWDVMEQQGMQFYAFNHSGTDLTTGMSIDFMYIAVVEWMHD